MAYHEQKLLSIDPSPTTVTAARRIVYNDKTLINRSVTKGSDGHFRLAADGDVIHGSIVGFSYGKVQLAVDGWDVRFINGTTSAIPVNSTLVGAAPTISGTVTYGLVRPPVAHTGTYALTTQQEHVAAKGLVTESDGTAVQGSSIVRAAITYGA